MNNTPQEIPRLEIERWEKTAIAYAEKSFDLFATTLNASAVSHLAGAKAEYLHLSPELEALKAKVEKLEREKHDYRMALVNAKIDLRYFRVDMVREYVEEILERYPSPSTLTDKSEK